MSTDIRWIMFDLGDVLYRYRPMGYARLAERLGVSVEALREFTDATGVLLDLSRGAIEPEDGCRRLGSHFGRPLSREDAVACFSGDLDEPLEGIEELIPRLKRHYRLAILSNTFFGHWDHFATRPIYAHFDMPMASHLLRSLKPEPTIYELALSRLEARPEQVVFVDDKAANVDAARALGINAVHSRSGAETREGLLRLGLRLDG